MFKKTYVYPKSWNDDDIIRFKYYMNEGRKMYNLSDDLLELCCERQIFEDKGMIEPIDYDKIEYYDVSQVLSKEIESVSINA